jgi:hypothetical protein
LKTLHLQNWTENFPLGGFHVNISAKTLDFWSADDMPNIENRLTPRWDNWTVNWHRDRYESQLELTKGFLQFPTYSRDFLEQKITQILLNETTISPLDSLFSFIEREKEKGNRFEISPWALKYAQLDLSINKRRQILMSALAATKNY